MAVSINDIIKVIASINNRYRDSTASTRMKLEALWEMGDQLVKMGIKAPHSVGWIIQRETQGLIKRPTIFRSHKVRTIWPSKKELLANLGQIKGLSNLIEIIPLIDPAQDVRSKLTRDQINDIYQHACSDSPKAFKQYINSLKRNFAHGRLGQSLDRSKYLKQLRHIVSDFRNLEGYLLKIFEQIDVTERNRFRADTSGEELRAFSNMCIALTTKDNFRLYRGLGSSISNSKNQQFKTLYNYFYRILNKTSDEERARLRRLISAEALASMSDMISSLSSEVAVEDFKARRKIAINL